VSFGSATDFILDCIELFLVKYIYVSLNGIFIVEFNFFFNCFTEYFFLAPRYMETQKLAVMATEIVYGRNDHQDVQNTHHDTERNPEESIRNGKRAFYSKYCFG
jgi:hypothetical protein